MLQQRAACTPVVAGTPVGGLSSLVCTDIGDIVLARLEGCGNGSLYHALLRGGPEEVCAFGVDADDTLNALDVLRQLVEHIEVILDTDAVASGIGQHTEALVIFSELDV